MESLDLFRNRSVLLLLVIPAALLLWTWSRRGRAIALPFDHAGARSSWLLKLVLKCCASLPAGLLAIAIVLLAGPQSWSAPSSKRVLTNIQFAVDVSGSMGAKFGSGIRYDAAMDAINRFLDFREGDAFGLTFFGNNVLHWVPLTTDVSAFRCAPPFMRPGQLPYWFGGTEIGKALLACRKVLMEREEGDRMIILISDGYSADLGGGHSDEVIRLLRGENIAVYTVHIAEGSIPDDIVRIAAETGGEAFKPEDESGLERIFARIDEMQLTRMEKTRAEAADQYLPWCLAGLVLLGLTLLAGFGLRYTPW
jgi:Ca-activated chloride channel family protein